MVEDIITGLSRMPWLFVIARILVSFTRVRRWTFGQVGRQLGVRYVLEGSVRKAGCSLCITAQPMLCFQWEFMSGQTVLMGSWLVHLSTCRIRLQSGLWAQSRPKL